jgi:uncharacterized protein YceK
MNRLRNAQKDAISRILLITLPCLLGGCGTLCTAAISECGKLEPYSGTRASAQGHATQLDLPFSFIADTVLLPITVPKALIEAIQTNDGAPPSSDAGKAKAPPPEKAP